MCGSICTFILIKKKKETAKILSDIKARGLSVWRVSQSKVFHQLGTRSCPFRPFPSRSFRRFPHDYPFSKRERPRRSDSSVSFSRRSLFLYFIGFRSNTSNCRFAGPLIRRVLQKGTKSKITKIEIIKNRKQNKNSNIKKSEARARLAEKSFESRDRSVGEYIYFFSNGNAIERR